MAESGLAIPPDQKRFHNASTLDRRAGVSIWCSSCVQPYPARTTAPAADFDFTAGPHLPQYVPHHVAAHAGTVGLDIRDRERFHSASHGPLDERRLRAR